MFKVMLDTKPYSSKPTTDELKNKINPRLIKNPVTISPEQLAIELTSGVSFVPAYLGTNNQKGLIARQKECWTNQQVFCLDFDNQIFVDDPDDTSRNKKIKQKKITMTWDQAKSEFKNTAMFMYKSFSYSDEWPKFRVVLAFHELIEDRLLFLGNAEHFISRYPDVDQTSIQENRLFYGGYDLYVFDYANRVFVQKSKTYKNVGFCHRNNYGIKHSNYCGNKNPPINNIDEYMIKNNKYKFDNIQLIRNKEKYYSKLTNQIFPPVTFTTRGEVYDYIKKYDMRLFLNIHTDTFYDLFHSEDNKSASIFQSNKTGYWYYKCHSDSHPFYGTLFDVVSRLTGYNLSKTFKYLCNIFNITIQKSEWQIEQEENYRHNLDFIKHFIDDSDEYISEAYPYLSSIFKSPLYFQVLREFNEFGLDSLEKLIQIENEDGIFFASISQILKRIYGNYLESDKHKSSKEKSVRVAIGILVLMKMLTRHELEKLPDEYVKTAKQVARKHKFKHTVEFYSIPSYDVNLMIEVEAIAKEFRRLGMTVKNFDRQMVLQTFGQEEADRCFPNRSQEKISNENISTCENLEKILVKYIEEFGWVTEQRILENVTLDIDVEKEMRKRNKKIKEFDIIPDDEKHKWLEQYKKSQFKKALGGFIQKYNLIKKPLNKQLMKELDIPIHYNENGNECYPTIIFKDK